MKKYDQIKHIDWLNKYVEYLNYKEKGLKKKAQESLKTFFLDFAGQDITVKRGFIELVNKVAVDNQDYSFFIPYNLYKDVLMPEIEKWMQDEPDNYVPYLWSYNFNLIKRALELNPFEQITLRLFGNMLVEKVSMNQHEIQHGYPYDGKPQDDIALIDFFTNYVNNIDSERERAELKCKLEDLKQCAAAYL